MSPGPEVLTVSDHSRASAGMRYVYAVVSRRAGGVSIGINLNPNNACNWRCIYCQVPGLTRGGPPPIDLDQLQEELEHMLDEIVVGEFLRQRVPEAQRRLVDLAFSGNGEPTSAREFPQAVELAIGVLAARRMLPTVKLRLITNGSLTARPAVRSAIARMGSVDGEVWFKVDAVDPVSVARINGVGLRMDSVARRLKGCGRLCATWVQTCLFALDGCPPSEAAIGALVDFLARVRDDIRGVKLYGLARLPAQPEAPRLQRLPPAFLDQVAERMRAQGLPVDVSP